MSIFTALTMPYNLEEAFGAKDCTTDRMKQAITDWFHLYYNQTATKDSDPCQRIAFTVVSKLAKTCFAEYQATSTDAFAQTVLSALDKVRKDAMQMLMIGGEAFLKPIFTPHGIAFSIIRRDNVLVFGRSASGTPTDIGTIERQTQGRFFYTLLERRSVDATGRLTIRNTLYRSDVAGTLGYPVPLESLVQYEALAEEYTFPMPLGGLGLVYMRMETVNCVDGSADGVSVYAPAVGLIHNIDRNEALMNGEFERGQSKVFASADLMTRDKNGRRRFSDDIFVALDESPEEIGVTIFSPTLREQSFLNRKAEYLRNVESVIGIKRGLLSKVETEEKTATEVALSNSDYNLTILDLQDIWDKAVKEAVRLCGILGKLYRMPGAHEIAEDAVIIDWGDGVLYNRDKVGQELLQQVQMGLLSPERYLGWYYELPCDTPAQREQIRREYMPEISLLIEE